ncbi:DUF3667 domain-containing protein [Erythrobacter litoralis]|uniref:DUF3667 domain-containing protein n=1 Tax=Erythrobacter litoralis (strain HTCC2594) TaxID=314225 RepID=Q2N7Q0_ERYLH|nr:DUF3667 domain-containing protein [Erythrobacter litoralis]ABC64291.1 hypothetical protein ELI_10995 [Erythrobacter litoralis HTCC2594]
MSEIGEALGTAAEGGLFARVVGGKFGKGRTPAAAEAEAIPEGACLNCGTELIGEHCHACGQKVHIHRTITAIFHDLIHGVLHLDGKLWTTLPLLTFKPGLLTRRYINGERAKFVSPMAMFLFSVFLMFAVFQAVGITTPSDLQSSDAIKVDMRDARERIAERVAEIERERDASAPRSDERARLDAELADARAALSGVTTGAEFTGAMADDPEFNVTGIDWIDRGIVRKWQENPGLMLYKLQANSYKFSWLLIPLSIPFVWLLFVWRRQFKAYDHAIFVTYSLAFMSLLFISLSVLGTIGVPLAIVLTAGTFIPPIHIYKQLRGTYGLGRFSAFWRLLALSVFIWVVVTLFLQVLLLLGAF